MTTDRVVRREMEYQVRRDDEVVSGLLPDYEQAVVERDAFVPDGVIYGREVRTLIDPLRHTYCSLTGWAEVSA